MPVKIRLQRHGKKGKAFFHIVVADGRAPRDGKFVEKLGTYNPTTNPATIELNNERALYWVQTGANPSDTARAILSFKGIMYRSHLQNGVRKGALTQEQADAKFGKWQSEKEAKIAGKLNKITASSQESSKKRLEAERTSKEAKAAKIAAKASQAAAAPAEEAAAPAAGEENA